MLAMVLDRLDLLPVLVEHFDREGGRAADLLVGHLDPSFPTVEAVVHDR